METPDVTCFPDGHFQRTIYGLCPYIADYPEQVLLSGVVQNWCLQYDYLFFGFLTTHFFHRWLANSKDLDGGQPCLH
jgi:Plavaka transposase